MTTPTGAPDRETLAHAIFMSARADLATLQAEREELQRVARQNELAMVFQQQERFKAEAERDALTARCEDLARSLTAANETHLADEQTIRNLEARHAQLDEAAPRYADHTGHRPRCVQVARGTWSCVPGCLWPQLAAAEAQVTALREESHVLAQEWVARRDDMIRLHDRALAEARAQAVEWVVDAGTVQSLERELDKRQARETALRKLLWLRHGCIALYGDDGEMQCGKCVLDFKRDDPSRIAARFEQIGRALLASPPPPEEPPTTHERNP